MTIQLEVHHQSVFEHHAKYYEARPRNRYLHDERHGSGLWHLRVGLVRT
jgi:hypothetical protein